MLFLFYYQYTIFGNPFRSIHAFLFDLPLAYSPTLLIYLKNFIEILLQYLFSLKVGLFSYTPLLLFPLLIVVIKAMTKKQPAIEQETSDQSLRRGLFRTMLIVIPIYIVFYTCTATKGLAEQGWQLYMFNLYSARHFLPIVLPLGYLLFDSIININKSKPSVKLIFWSILVILWVFSLITNITATLIGDWIFSLGQIWGYAKHILYSWYNGLPIQRVLVDW
jgi:hypothetical protein